MKTVTKVQLGNEGVVYVVDSREDKSIRARIRDNAPHSHYAVDRTDIHKELSAFKKVCRLISPNACESVLELFGGSGWHSLLIQRYVTPGQHCVVDIDADCVESIQLSVPSAIVHRTNSIHLLMNQWNDSWDWVHADFNQFTMGILRSDRKMKTMVANIFRTAKDVVTITDSTPYGLLNESHKNDWYKAFAEHVRLAFGWEHVTTVDWGPSAMHCFASEQKDLENGLYNQHVPLPIVIDVDEAMEVKVLETQTV